MARTQRKKIRILEEGVELIQDVDSLNFTGAGVTGSNVGNDVTETIPGGGGTSDSFETVSANLSAYDYTLNYNVNGDIASIDYSNGVTKTFNYTGDDITSIVLSGSTPGGIELTKTLTYSSGDITSIVYS
jgi:hypothetical protein